jgi:Divergent InlB B-repeat domain
MGVKGSKGKGSKALLTLLAILLSLAFAGQAQAAAPSHARKSSLDITGLNKACGAVVDSKGDLYASSAGESKVKVFNAEHKPLTEIADANTPCGLAVTTTGDLYVSEQATGDVVRFKPNKYPFEGTPTYGSREVIDSSGSAKGIAVDAFDSRLFVAEGSYVAAYKADGSLEGKLLEGKVSEATALGVFSNPYVETESLKESVRYLSVAEKGANDVKVFNALNSTEKSQGTLKLRRTLSGPNGKESFGFGAKGSALAADSKTGHFVVYDASHSAVDEFDATGEFLDQTTNASLTALGDAEPGALAYDRSGTQSPDGALYVGAGASAGAKLLAFGGLSTPTRELLKERSEKLTVPLARAIATDRYGDVYVAAETQVYVHDSSGKLLMSFEDELEPYALATDSEGNVYVLDGPNTSEQNLTYYEPDSFPPSASTTYTRHEPQLLEATGTIESLAVNPANDHVFAGRGISSLAGTAKKKIEQWGSAKEGSPPIGGEPPVFAPFFSSANGVKGLGVYGANGSVYVSDSNASPQFDVIDPEGTEFLSRASGICKGEKAKANASIGVDQSNSHMLEFRSGQPKAREYDAAGVCVAEFGSFAEGTTAGIAVDNACTLHRNGKGELEPLTGKACEEFDPANGNAYFAFDGNNNTTQPYDVTAFGPLSYPAATPETSKFKLMVSKAGTGSGKVTSSPSGIDCGATCTAEFEEGTKVTLTQEAAAGSKFSGWSGACTGTGSCVVTMTEAKSVTASFEATAKAKFKLTVSKAGAGQGKVTSSPAGIECGATCTAEFEEGTLVTLSASAEAGSTFAGWSGSGCSGTGSCKVTMTEAKSVTATFNLEQHLLTVTREGTGTGTVKSAPTGIECGATCSASFAHGTTVTLTGTSGAKTKAVAWSGCDSVNGENKCLVAMTAARSVKATFDLEAATKFKLTVTKTGAGSGKVTSSPAGISCGATCSAEFEEGKVVKLTAAPEAGSEFRGWSGACSGAQASCEVTMSEAKTVNAFFAHAKQTLKVIQKGTGSGTTSSKPKGVKCSLTCALAEARLYKGTAVLLKVLASSTSSIAGITGCDKTTTISELEATCEVAMSSARTVEVTYGKTAKAILNPKALTFEKQVGTGQGTVKATGLTCEAACSLTNASYTSGDGAKKLPATVTLKAIAAFGSQFTAWGEGQCKENPTPTECVVTMSEARTVTAQFSAKPLVALTLTRSGGGTVSSKPKGIKCAATCDTAIAALPQDTPVVLKALAASGSEFSSWEGCTVLMQTTLESTCEVTLTAAKAVKATFTAPLKPLANPKTLTLSKAGSGYGTVKATGLTCEAACTQTKVKYTGGDGGKKLPATVTLKATSQAGSDPVSWTGCESNPTPSECVVEMNADKEVIARFEE